MDFLTYSSKTATANQVNTWYNTMISSMETAKTNFDSLVKQLEAMKTNTDYTEEDIAVVQKLIDNWVQFAVTLVPKI